MHLDDPAFYDRVFLVGLALAYCLVYLLAKLSREYYRWTGLLAFLLVAFPVSFIAFVVIENTMPSYGVIALSVLGSALIVGAGLRLTSQPTVARYGAALFSVFFGFAFSFLYMARWLNVRMPPQGYDFAGGLFITAAFVGLIGSIVAVSGKKFLTGVCVLIFVRGLLSLIIPWM